MPRRITLANLVHTGGRRVALPPLGVLYLAAVLRRSGWEVEIRDYQHSDAANPFSVERVRAFLEGSAPLVALSCFAQFLPQAGLALRELKRRRPELRILLGGPGPASVAEPLLDWLPEADAVALGEGEPIIAALAEELERGRRPKNVPGIAFRDGARVARTAPPARVRDLDALPPPAFDLVDLARYQSIYTMTSRGCRYRCAFCAVPSLWGPAVFRRVETILEEIAATAARSGHSRFLIADDNFAADRRRAIEFCRRLAAAGLKLRWWCYARVDSLDPELMQAMAEAGCDLVEFGIESGSGRVLKAIGKGAGIARAEQTLDRCLDYFNVQVSYTWGYPFETLDDFERTLESLARVVRLARPGREVLPFLFRVSPMPGTPLFHAHRGDITPPEGAMPFGQGSYEEFELLPGPELPGEVVELVRRRPDVFVSLCTYRTPQCREKLERREQFRQSSLRLLGKAALDGGFGARLRANAFEAAPEAGPGGAPEAILAAAEVARALRQGLRRDGSN